MKRQRTMAKAVSGTIGRELVREAADWELVETVSTVVAAAAEGVTVVGLKEQVAPTGRPEQAKLTTELKPYCGVTVNVTVPSPPELTVSAEGDA
jgi:hypothetical protein